MQKNKIINKMAKKSENLTEEEKKILEYFPDLTDNQVYFLEELKEKYFKKGLKYAKNI